MAQARDGTAGQGAGPAPIRLVGALANGVVVGASTSARERIRVQGMASVAVRAKLSAVTLSPDIQVVPQGPSAAEDDTDTEDRLSGATAVTVLTAAEVIHEYTLKGERYVDVVVTSAAGESATIDYIDVFVKPL